MSTTHRRAGQAIAAAGIGALALLGAVVPAGAAPARPKPQPPLLTISGLGTWQVRENGDAVVNGTGTLQLNGSKKAKTAEVAATVGADDRTLPEPGTCEGAISTITAIGPLGREITLMGHGEVCGQFVQEPTSIITHVFTGTYEVLDGAHRRMVGTDGFFEIRLAVDGTASVFAIDT